MFGFEARKVNWLILLLPILLPGCFHNHPLKNAVALPPSVDSISLLSVDGPHTLASGKPVRFVVRLTYTLNSYDKASLSLRLQEFSNPESCIGFNDEVSDRNNADSTAAIRIPIFRGTRELEIPITWSGSDANPNDYLRKQGALSLQSSMWLDHPNYRFLTRSFGTEFCQRFSSSP